MTREPDQRNIFLHTFRRGAEMDLPAGEEGVPEMDEPGREKAVKPAL